MKYTFFWGGPFSQWKPSEFEVDNVQYSCAEQYMMASKARLFRDSATLGKIMKASTPKEQKMLGRIVTNFNPKLWDEKCREIVYTGNVAKFSQNLELSIALRNTIGTLLVEASPYDKVWGIGIGPDDPKRLDPKNWNGSNYLGEVLTVVRKNLFANKDDSGFNFDWEL